LRRENEKNPQIRSFNLRNLRNLWIKPLSLIELDRSYDPQISQITPIEKRIAGGIGVCAHLERSPSGRG